MADGLMVGKNFVVVVHLVKENTAFIAGSKQGSGRQASDLLHLSL